MHQKSNSNEYVKEIDIWDWYFDPLFDLGRVRVDVGYKMFSGPALAGMGAMDRAGPCILHVVCLHGDLRSRC